MVLLWSLDINSTILDSKYIYNVGYFAKVLARALRSFAIQVIFFYFTSKLRLTSIVFPFM